MRTTMLAAALVLGAALPAFAQGGLTRTTLDTTDLPGTSDQVLLAVTEIAANAEAPRHTHPGVESSYVEAGDGELMIEGQPNRHVAAGDHFQVPPGVPHSVDAGSRGLKIVTTYVVEKDRPLATPAPK